MRKLLVYITVILFFYSGQILSQSIEKPEIIKFGDTKSNIMMALNDACKIAGDQSITPTELPTAKTSQSQVDCEKFHYFGKKRNAEFIFADGILDMVWILTEAEEQDTLIAGFTKLYGKPTHVTSEMTFFLNNGVGVRNNPNEVLFISDRLKKPYEAFLEKK